MFLKKLTKEKKLENGYFIEIDEINKSQWSDLLMEFDDATINQTWCYGSVRWEEANLSHLVLKKDDEIVAAAQLRIIKPPLFNAGIAYISWGPLWCLRGRRRNLDYLRQVFRALRNEYTVRRSLLLRVFLNVFECNTNANVIRLIIEAEGYSMRPNPYRTLLLDLEPSMEQVRKNFSKDWRKNLKKAERNNLSIREGTGDELYKAACILYNEMVARKGFVSVMNVDDFRAIQKDLPDSLKMRIMLCEFEGKPIAALVGSGLGDMGIELVAAICGKALNLRASYLLRWRMIQWLKECGCRSYNLGGIDPEKNPGGYQFKSGLAGKSGKEALYIGQFEACQSLLSSFLVKLGDQLRSISMRRKYLAKKISHLFKLNNYNQQF